MDIQPGTPVDRFIVTELVGRGGHASVWKARHRQLGTMHAIKILEIHRKSIQQRLLLEGRIQAAIRHPNVVAVTDVVEFKGTPALVLEWVDGFPLNRLIQRHRLTMDQVDSLMSGVFEGMIEVERRGLIHRDLKPANILMALQGDQLVPKVADFGIVKVLEDDSDDNPTTRSGSSMGTPAYMAIEQFRDAKEVDIRADVFSLGAILYELCSGKKTYGGRDLVQLVYQVAEERYEPLVDVLPDLPEARRQVIARALRADRDLRFPSIAEMRDAWFTHGRPLTVDWTDIISEAHALRLPPVKAAPVPQSEWSTSDESAPTRMAAQVHAAVPETVEADAPPARAPSLAPPSLAPPSLAPPSGAPATLAPTLSGTAGPGWATVGLAVVAAALLGAVGALGVATARGLGVQAMPTQTGPGIAVEIEDVPQPPAPAVEGPADPALAAPVPLAEPTPNIAAPGPTPRPSALAVVPREGPIAASAVAPAPTASIRPLVRERQGAVLDCITPLSVDDPSYSASQWLHWRVASDGSTHDARLGEGTIDDPGARACIVEAIAQWTFPPGAVEGPFSYQISVANE